MVPASRSSSRQPDSTCANIGVVVVSHNSAEDLPACLAALGAAEGVERVVVVDNASHDASREVVRAVEDPRVILVEEKANSGFAGGCNRGFEELDDDCEVLAFLNPDVGVEADCLSRCAEALMADPGLAGVAPRLMRTDGRTVDTVGQVLKGFNLEVEDRGYGAPPTAELIQPRTVLAACGALAVFRRSALESVAENHGPWAQHYFCFCRPPELEACILTNRWMTLIRHLHPLDLALRLPVLLLWDPGLVAAGALRRPSLAGHLRQRWPLVVSEWRGRHRFPRRRLHELL